jgi:hypothetical protein
VANRLHLLLRVDPRGPESELLVHGRLTPDGVRDLLPVVLRGLDLAGDHRLTIDLTHARHVEDDALALLHGIAPYLGVRGPARTDRVAIRGPQPAPAPPGNRDRGRRAGSLFHPRRTRPCPPPTP